jgi:hypothetical protein
MGGHAGGGPGYATAAFHFPNLVDAQVTIVALLNRDEANYGLMLVDKIAQVLLE